MKKTLLALCALITLLVYCACTPEVKITGDAENPIAINAEINIHIYQHAAEVVDDLYADLDDEPEPDSSSNGDNFAVRFLAKLVKAVSISEAEAAETKSKAYQTMRDIFRDTFTKYMKTGYVGENLQGYVSYIGKADKLDAATANAAKTAVAKLNAARKAFYQEEAKNQKTTLEEIQKTYALAYASKAKGIWVETRDGDKTVWKKF